MTRSIQQLPNNSGSTSIVEVPTNTGFSAGDLVYLSGGDYKPMSSLTLPTSANFPYSVSAPVTSGAFGNTYNPVFSGGTSGTGGSRGKFAATLTNGNIVQVWVQYETPYSPYFQIVNSSGTVVVAATSISGTYVNSSLQPINVVALTGGGFAVCWLSTAGGTAYGFNYAIYTNTGSVTLSPTQETTVLGAANHVPNMVALANGGFAVVTKAATTFVVNHRAFSATGTAAYAWTAAMTGVIGTNQVGIAARSDNSIVLLDMTAATTVAYYVIKSDGTAITNSTITVTSNSSNAPYYLDATTLSDGTTFILSYGNLGSTATATAFRLLPTGNSLGSEILIPTANQVCTSSTLTTGTGFSAVLGLSSGGFVMALTDNTMSLQYIFYNASGTALSGTNGSGAVPFILNGSYVLSKPTLIEVSGSVYIYWHSSGYNNKTWNQQYHQISTTTYLPTVSNGVTQTLGTVTSGTNGVSVATSYPSGVKALALTTEKDLVSMPMGASSSLAQPYNSLCDSIAVTTLTNGNFVITYRDVTTLAVYASVYSTTLALLATISVGTAASGNIPFATKVAAMPSGKFVVAYMSAGTTLTVKLYSATYTNTSSVVLSTVTNPGSYWTFAVAGLTTDRFVVAYRDSSTTYPTFAVYDNTCALISGPTSVASVAAQGIFGVSANNWGGFAVSYNRAASTYGQLTAYVNNGTSTYTAAGTSQTITAASPSIAQGFNLVSTGSMYYVPGWQSTTTTGLYGSPDTGTATARTVQVSGSTIATTQDTSTYALLSIGCTGYGGLVMAYVNSSVTTPFTAITFQALPPNGSGVGTITAYSAITYPSSSTYILNTGLSTNTNYLAPQLCLTPAYGHNIAFAFLNASGFPTIGLVSTGYPASSYVSLTAGTSTSNNITITPSANATGAVSGVLTGVALTSATAGSAGQVAINGPAQLNTNYSATNTGSFDYTGQAVNGVKGIVNGRLVTLQGNS
jgi:hypothetical protein